MATRKLVRDLVLCKQLLYQHLLAYKQVSTTASRFRLIGGANGRLMCREFSVFKEFSEKIKGEVNRRIQSMNLTETIKGLLMLMMFSSVFKNMSRE
ncbi:hypothetical protein HanPI659440_Chr11g0404651 [Helianthus annuus]|nr:hypothetical protein HanPI659440_Chr11g0404651 [Helianthus annuus]